MKYSYAFVALVGLATANSFLDARQVAAIPAPGSPESFAQTASILGGLASGLKGMSGVPFSADAAKVFDGLAKGLDGAGQVAAGKKPPGRLAVRQTVPVVPALGSPESFAQAASILGGIASGLKGQSSIPFAADAASALDGLAKGLGNAGQAAKKSPGRMALRQIAAAGSPESKAQAAAILTGLAQGLKGTSIPYGNDASAALTSIAKGLSGSA